MSTICDKTSAVLVGSGEIANYSQLKEYSAHSYVIACDGGSTHCIKASVTPDIVIGDLDSANIEVISALKNNGIEVITYPTHKDNTDMELGLKLAVDKGFKDIYIFGGIGSRLDHTLANIHILNQAPQNVSAWLINEHNKVTLVSDSLTLTAKKGSLVSLIPLTTSVKVTTSGLEYPLTDYNMTVGYALGVSNTVLSNKFSVNVKDGILIVILSQD
jgi:thiamine pyrophosphokinase